MKRGTTITHGGREARKNYCRCCCATLPPLTPLYGGWVPDLVRHPSTTCHQTTPPTAEAPTGTPPEIIPTPERCRGRPDPILTGRHQLLQPGHTAAEVEVTPNAAEVTLNTALDETRRPKMSNTHGDRKLARPKQKVKQNRCSGVRSPCHLEISLHPTENSQRQSHGNGQHTNDPWKRTRRSRTRLRDPQVPGRKSRPPGAHGSPAEPGRRHTEELTTETLRGTPNDRRTVPTHGIGGGKTGHPIPDTTTRDRRTRNLARYQMA